MWGPRHISSSATRSTEHITTKGEPSNRLKDVTTELKEFPSRFTPTEETKKKNKEKKRHIYVYISIKLTPRNRLGLLMGREKCRPPKMHQVNSRIRTWWHFVAWIVFPTITTRRCCSLTPSPSNYGSLRFWWMAFFFFPVAPTSVTSFFSFVCVATYTETNP